MDDEDSGTKPDDLRTGRELILDNFAMERCKTHTLRGGLERHIHILGPVLNIRMKTGDHSKPIIAIRPASTPNRIKMYRHIEIQGPSVLMDRPEDPLPGTKGRAICYLRTSAPIKVYRSTDDAWMTAYYEDLQVEDDMVVVFEDDMAVV
jgi:hypothetical protein